MGRSHHGRVPVGSIFQVLGLLPKHVLGVGFNRTHTLVDVVIFGECAIDGGGVDQSRILWVKGNVCALTSTHGEVIFVANTTVKRAASDRHAGIILLPRVEPKGRLVVRNDPIKLCRRLVHDAGPRGAAIEGYRRTTVVAVDEVLTVLRAEPHVMVITVWRRSLFKGFTTIDRFHEWCVEHPDRIGVLRIGFDVNVVPGARPDDALVI